MWGWRHALSSWWLSSSRSTYLDCDASQPVGRCKYAHWMWCLCTRVCVEGQGGLVGVGWGWLTSRRRLFGPPARRLREAGGGWRWDALGGVLAAAAAAGQPHRCQGRDGTGRHWCAASCRHNLINVAPAAAQTTTNNKICCLCAARARRRSAQRARRAANASTHSTARTARDQLDRHSLARGAVPAQVDEAVRASSQHADALVAGMPGEGVGPAPARHPGDGLCLL